MASSAEEDLLDLDSAESDESPVLVPEADDVRRAEEEDAAAAAAAKKKAEEVDSASSAKDDAGAGAGKSAAASSVGKEGAPAGGAKEGANKDEDEQEEDEVDINDAPHAIQIVSIGTPENQYAFTYHEQRFRSLLAKIPPTHKVCVVSVVGAFRTGKSFLLSWFLRYLHYHSSGGPGGAGGGGAEAGAGAGASTKKGEKAGEGEKKWYEEFETLGNEGFDWRGGSTRNTTGIWIWSHPHYLTRPAPTPRDPNKTEEIAVLLVDTQGMFDHETTMGLTAAIFGLSTLLSSYQIYNVDKRIQEDHLQQLALFSEYGRMALQEEKKEQLGKLIRETAGDAAKKDEKDDKKAAEGEKPAEKGEGEAIKEKEEAAQGEEEGVEVDAEGKPELQLSPSKKPFQRIEFLVRDWQHFETDLEEDSDDEGGSGGGMDFKALEEEMATYLSGVIAERDAKDLKDTRAQILSCFDDVGCFMLTHPGFAVTKKKYAGDVGSVEPTFLALLDRFCERVFFHNGESVSASSDEHEEEGGDNAQQPKKKLTKLAPKIIHGRELTALELGTYVKTYASLFSHGAKFPEASTMLEATASANNANASVLSVKRYREFMDRVAGTKCSSYLRREELIEFHRDASQMALSMFDDMANFGNRSDIEKVRGQVEKELRDDYEVYDKLNDSRNPLLGFETYLIPMAIAFFSFVLRWIADATCSGWSQTCRVGSDILSEVYTVVVIFLLIVGSTKARQIQEAFHRIKAAFEAMGGDVPSSSSSGGAVSARKKND